MTRARIASGTVFVVALAGCSHRGAPVAPPPVPMPASLDVAVTDAPDSVATWLTERGAYRSSARGGDTLHLESVVADAGPALLVHRVPARDARDAIDAGVDVLLTGDPEAIAYAATRADLTSLPSAWNRTYVLLVRADPPSDAERAPARDTLRGELATGAVRVEARPATASRADSCVAREGATPTPDGIAPAARPRIVYSRTDDVARALAARLVALGSSRRELLAALAPSLVNAGDSLRAEGMDAVDVPLAVQAGGAVAAVMAVSPMHFPACGFGPVPLTTTMQTRVIALIQTRERLIARRGLTGRALEALARAVGDSSQVGP